MSLKLTYFLAALFSFEVLFAKPVELRVSSSGYLQFPGGAISLDAFLPGWHSPKFSPDYAALMVENKSSPEHVVRQFKVCRKNNEVLFTGTYSWKVSSKTSIKGKLHLECVADCEMRCLALAAKLDKNPSLGSKVKAFNRYQFPTDNGYIVLEFSAETPSFAQNFTKRGGNWNVRFGKTMNGRTYSKGDVIEWDFILSTSSGEMIKLIPSQTVTIGKGEDWTPLFYKKDIEKGSALDFSDMGLQDAPAGKYGWLKAVGGRFEFEKLPGVEQRFYGVNLCFGANYLTHDDADMVVERLVRCGYNSIRIHHHDGAWFESDENREKLDYLIAKAIGKGLYITTDLYVSRAVKWKDIGINRDGVMSMSLYKAYVGVNESAFQNWALHAKSFLDHVNPYTGRAYKDEPAMPFISLVNEGRLVISWDQSGKSRDQFIIAAWKEFGGTGELPRPNWSDRNHPFNRFDEWVNLRVWEKCTAFLRSFGCKALLSNDNDGAFHGDGEGLTPRYDYVDNHFYIDLPKFLERSWSLPSRRDNVNPIKKGEPEIFNKGWAKGSSKPYTITEWNFAGPGRYRAMGGILTGALASEHEWDGLWRFAYSHSNKKLKDNKGHPEYFDSVSDPLMAASDRASVCLFLRGDATGGTLKTDKETGSVSIVSERTCGGFTESGTINAGILAFKTVSKSKSKSTVPTTLWISSLDGKSIGESSRMLLVHLTDLQGKGACYADGSRQILLKWGGECLVENVFTEVRLKVESAGKCKVYELDTSGKRIAIIPSRVQNGTLRFNVSTSGPYGGRMYYEIAR